MSLWGRLYSEEMFWGEVVRAGISSKVFFFPVPKMFISGALNHFWHWIIVRRLLELAALLLVAVAWQATIQNTNYVCVHNFLSLLFWQ